MATNTRQLAFGALLLLASTIVILGVGVRGSAIPGVLAALAAIGMAAGSLLVGLSELDAAV